MVKLDENDYCRATSELTIESTVFTMQAPEINPLCEVTPGGQTLYLSCGSQGSVISEIEFASYGTPSGVCGAFDIGTCHLSNSSAVLAELCVGKPTCVLNVSGGMWPDPCYGTVKWLAAQVRTPFYTVAYVIFVRKDIHAYVRACLRLCMFAYTRFL